MPLYGWSEDATVDKATGLHPVSKRCAVPVLADNNSGSQIRATLHLWKRGNEKFTDKELLPVISFKVSKDNKTVTVKLSDNTVKTVRF